MLQKDPSTPLSLEMLCAMCGSDVDLGTLDYQFVFVFDNEPRTEIVNRISRAIDNGSRVVIFPNTVKDKDLE